MPVLPAGFGLVPVGLVPAPVLGVAPVLSVAVLLSVPLVPVLGVVVLGMVPVDGAVLGGDVVDEVVAPVVGVEAVEPVVGVELVPDVWAAAARAAATSRPRNRKMSLRCMRCSSRIGLNLAAGSASAGLPCCCEMGMEQLAALRRELKASNSPSGLLP
jgi:hypothetical protein